MIKKIIAQDQTPQKDATEAILEVLQAGPIDLYLLDHILKDNYTQNQVEEARWALVLSDRIRYTFNGEIELI